MPSSKKGKAGGLALAAAAIGIAIKGRGKLGATRGQDTGTPASSTTNSSPPATPPGV